MLVNPPWYTLFGKSSFGISLGLLYIGAVLKTEGFDIKLYDADVVVNTDSTTWMQAAMGEKVGEYIELLGNKNNILWRKIEREIISYNPDFIGVSCVTPTFNSGLLIAQMAKRIKPEVKTIFGGVHPTVKPFETMNNKEIDFVVYGEGETTVLELVNEIMGNANYERVKGLLFKEKSGNIIKTDPRPLIDNLDSIPFPDRSMIYGSSTIEQMGKMITSRGCPYQCIFCCSHLMWGRKVRFRSPENVVDEIEYIYKNYKTNKFHFHDDTFTLKRERVIKICELIKKRRLKIRWSCDTRVNTIDPDLLKIMKRAGCFSMAFGVETGNKDILKSIKKGVSHKQIIEGFKITKKAGLQTRAYFMVGLPGETRGTVNDTIKFMKKISPDKPELSLTVPYPGTELYEQALNNKWITGDIDWSYYFQAGIPVMNMPQLSDKNLLEIFHKTLKIFDKHKIVKAFCFKNIRIKLLEFKNLKSMFVSLKYGLKIIFGSKDRMSK